MLNLRLTDAHEVVTTPLANYLQREFKRPIFTYWHRAEGVWVVAAWVHKENRIARELAVVGPSLENANRNLIDDIRAFFNTDIRDNMRKARGMYRDGERDQIDSERDFADFKRWVYKRSRVPSGRY